MISGVVDSVERYAAPGVQLRRGQTVSVVLRAEPVDTNDSAKGTRLTLVKVASAD